MERHDARAGSRVVLVLALVAAALTGFLTGFYSRTVGERDSGERALGEGATDSQEQVSSRAVEPRPPALSMPVVTPSPTEISGSSHRETILVLRNEIEELQRAVEFLTQQRVSGQEGVADYFLNPGETYPEMLNRVFSSRDDRAIELLYSQFLASESESSDSIRMALEFLGGNSIDGSAMAAAKYLGRRAEASELLDLEERYDRGAFPWRFKEAVALHVSGNEDYMEMWTEDAFRFLRADESLASSILVCCERFPLAIHSELLTDLEKTFVRTGSHTLVERVTKLAKRLRADRR